jgi:hypothetical protein
MKLLKLILVIIVYFFYLPYLIVMLGFEMLKNIIYESINYFQNTSI